MQIPFPFEAMLTFGGLAIMLLVGVLLRAKVSVFQRYLIPSCLIGGILGLILLNINLIKLSVSNLETFAYHFFNISFISVGLTRTGKQDSASTQNKIAFKGPLWMALTQSAVFPLQAIIGGLFIILFAAFGFELFPTFGFFAPLGFNEGPGQALSFGKVWEGLGFENAATIGATFATIGYFFAFFVGVPLVNWGHSKRTFRSDPQTIAAGFFNRHHRQKSGPQTGRCINDAFRQHRHPGISGGSCRTGLCGNLCFYQDLWQLIRIRMSPRCYGAFSSFSG